MTKPKEHPLIEAVKTLPAFQELEAHRRLPVPTIDHDDEGRPWVTGKRVGGAVLNASEYTPEERRAILGAMRRATDAFYRAAASAGCHAFIEFAGLMNEFIVVCADAEERGDHGWVHANGHGENMALEPYQVAYIREKLGCIYGDSVLESELE